MSKVLDKKTMRRLYDWIGSKLDSQSFYEQSGLDEVIRHGAFDTARAVFEFGCGTGRFAQQLFAKYLPAEARYTAIDISPTMVAITRKRLQAWEARTSVLVSEGSVRLDFADKQFDRFICSYVVDLLSDEEAILLIDEAHRILKEGGLMCLVSITTGTNWFSKLLMASWQLLNRLHPLLTGGCRPVRLRRLIKKDKWKIDFHEVLSKYGVTVEVLIALRK